MYWQPPALTPYASWLSSSRLHHNCVRYAVIAIFVCYHRYLCPAVIVTLISCYHHLLPQSFLNALVFASPNHLRASYNRAPCLFYLFHPHAATRSLHFLSSIPGHMSLCRPCFRLYCAFKFASLLHMNSRHHTRPQHVHYHFSSTFLVYHCPDYAPDIHPSLTLPPLPRY